MYSTAGGREGSSMIDSSIIFTVIIVLLLMVTSACDVAVVCWSKDCIDNSEDLKVIAFIRFFVALASWHDSEATQWTLGGGGHGISECRAACHAQAAVNMFFRCPWHASIW